MCVCEERKRERERREKRVRKNHPPSARGCYFLVRLLGVAHSCGRMCVINTWWSKARSRIAATTVRPSVRPSVQRVLVLLFFLPLGRKLVEVLYSLRLSLLLLLHSTDGRVCVFFDWVCVWPSVLKSRRKKSCRVIWMLYGAVYLFYSILFWLSICLSTLCTGLTGVLEEERGG